MRTELADHRTVSRVHGGTVNDVVLATVAGALRAWLMSRPESLRGLRQIRALAPVSVIDEELEATSLGSQIAPHFVDLPVGEPSPVVRLHQVSYSFLAHRETGRGVAANRLAGIAGFAPATFHAIGSRVAAEEQRRGFQLSVTNVPGPQSPLYAAGARMVGTYPVPPLLPGHGLAIGVTSYDGGVYYGVTADRDLLPDADLLAPCLHEALDELVETASGARTRAPRGRTGGGRPGVRVVEGGGAVVSVRIYLPATSSLLATLHSEGRLPGPLRAHAVTEALRGEWPEGDEESLEYAAMMAAAAGSPGLRGGADRPRRYVVAADVPAVVPVPGRTPRSWTWPPTSCSSGSPPCTPTPRTAPATTRPGRTTTSPGSRPRRSPSALVDR